MKNRCLSIFVCAALLLSLVVTPEAFAGVGVTSATSTYLGDVMNLVKNYYNYDVGDEALTQGALKGIFGSMDDYTEFFTPEEMDSFMEEVDGSYCGIGVVLAKIDGCTVITRVMPNSPAERVGLRAGDKIAVVDKTEVVGESLDKIISLIKGNKGTQITLGIVRNGSKDLISVTTYRDTIRINPVTYEIRNGIGYIAIESFNSNTYASFREALDYMDAHRVDRLILDLRNNTGGEVDQAVAVARHLVPEGIITRLDFKSPDFEDTTYTSNLKNPRYKLAVLVNGMTASASEILAGAVQDTKAGFLVGTKTFGKARVQNVFPLLTPEAAEKYSRMMGRKVVSADEVNGDVREDEIAGYAKITVATYTTPAGRMIDMQGLTPDYPVADHGLVKDIYVNNVMKLSLTDKPGLNGEGLDVYNAEKILRLSGYDVDLPDTHLDAKTFNAIAQYQKSVGLGAYGVLDFSTQKSLNERLESLWLEIDKQYARAVELL